MTLCHLCNVQTRYAKVAAGIWENAERFFWKTRGLYFSSYIVCTLHNWHYRHYHYATFTIFRLLSRKTWQCKFCQRGVVLRLRHYSTKTSLWRTPVKKKRSCIFFILPFCIESRAPSFTLKIEKSTSRYALKIDSYYSQKTLSTDSANSKLHIDLTN